MIEDRADVKTKLPEILRRVEAGESFTITNRGRPIADLIPSKEERRGKIQAMIQGILTAKKVTLEDDELEELRATGRK